MAPSSRKEVQILVAATVELDSTWWTTTCWIATTIHQVDHRAIGIKVEEYVGITGPRIYQGERWCRWSIGTIDHDGYTRFSWVLETIWCVGGGYIILSKYTLTIYTRNILFSLVESSSEWWGNVMVVKHCLRYKMMIIWMNRWSLSRLWSCRVSRYRRIQRSSRTFWSRAMNWSNVIPVRLVSSGSKMGTWRSRRNHWTLYWFSWEILSWTSIHMWIRCTWSSGRIYHTKLQLGNPFPVWTSVLASSMNSGRSIGPWIEIHVPKWFMIVNNIRLFMIGRTTRRREPGYPIHRCRNWERFSTNWTLVPQRLPWGIQPELSLCIRIDDYFVIIN